MTKIASVTAPSKTLSMFTFRVASGTSLSSMCTFSSSSLMVGGCSSVERKLFLH